ESRRILLPLTARRRERQISTDPDRRLHQCIEPQCGLQEKRGQRPGLALGEASTHTLKLIGGPQFNVWMVHEVLSYRLNRARHAKHLSAIALIGADLIRAVILVELVGRDVDGCRRRRGHWGGCRWRRALVCGADGAHDPEADEQQQENRSSASLLAGCTAS